MPSSEGNRTSAFQELLKDAVLQEEFAFLREPPRGKAWLGHLGFRIFGMLLFNFWCPLRTLGRDKLPEPPFILCSNHSSHSSAVSAQETAPALLRLKGPETSAGGGGAPATAL